MSEIKGLFEFVKESPTAFHTVESVKRRLIAEGYTELSEADSWELCDAEKYFVTRNGSSLIAFRHNLSATGFMISAAHTDQPAPRVKNDGQLKGTYTRLNTEKYGGMIYRSWLDRPLSVAGRVILESSHGISTKLVNIDKDLAVIPDLAIHLNRQVNDNGALNPATDLLAVYGLGDADSLNGILARELSVAPESIISHDLFLYNREEGRVVGDKGELILCPRLDDLECVYAAMEGFLQADTANSLPVLALFDNEEVGSATKQGAASTFLADTLSRIAQDPSVYRSMLYCSFMLSADNAHAIHPNHPELSDKANAPVLNGGVVIKFNASQRYATDSVSHALFATICKRAGVKTQNYYNRADLPGGSTLGSISDTVVSIPTVDIGLPQLAMHSSCETAGSADLAEMIKAHRAFYSTSLVHKGDKYVF